MRLFVAVFPPLEVREALLLAAENVLADSGLRPTRPGNVHLTLKFLGEVPEDAVPGISAALARVCARHEPFVAGLSGLGAFPSARRARVLWSGIGAGSERLISLAADVDGALAPLGFEREERAYVPHLTLARARRRPVSLDLPDDVTPGSEVPGFTVERVELVKSRLGAGGSVYGTIGEFPLGSSGRAGS